MPNPFYSDQAAPDLGPRATGTAATTTGNSRKGQRGGWLATSNKTSTGSPGKDSPGWVCSTTKPYGLADDAEIVSTSKPESEEHTEWTISSEKGGS
jgi:hypothetical protein